MPPEEEDELAANLRKRVLDVLKLVASFEEQAAYEARAPGINIANEMFNQWEDWYRPGQREFIAAFSEHELEALSDFDLVSQQVAATTPMDLPPVGDFARTEAWRRYSQAAGVALGVLRGASDA